VHHPTQRAAGTQHSEEALLTPRQLQDRLQIGERLCYRMLQDGRLPGFRVGRLWRVREDDLHDALGKDG
jgi:excisionase family DNA binding protein